MIESAKNIDTAVLKRKTNTLHSDIVKIVEKKIFL